jgi:hypothetical protein
MLSVAEGVVDLVQCLCSNRDVCGVSCGSYSYTTLIGRQESNAVPPILHASRRCACVCTFAHRSKVLLNALSSACDHSIISNFTLAAPTEWLQSWVPSCINEAEPLSGEEIRVLVNCLQERILQIPRQSSPLMQ